MGKIDKLRGNLGTELKKIRTQKRISLEKIGSKLRINVKFLQSIENNQFDFLHRPYVLAFVKSYAVELGLDPDDVKEKFDQQLRSQFDSPSIEKKNKPPEISTSPHSTESITPDKPAQNIEFGNFIKQNKKSIVVVTVLILFISLLFLLQKFYFGPQENTPSTPTTSQIPAVNSRSTLIDTSNRVSTANIPLELRLITNDRLWIRMSVDNGTPREYIFGQNETQSWTAQDRFELRMGKSVGFQLYFNDSLLQDLGDENTMIGNLVLTKDGIGDLRLLQQPPDTTIQR